jgi:uncharacterized delta-60 repeat protein
MRFIVIAFKRIITLFLCTFEYAMTIIGIARCTSGGEPEPTLLGFFMPSTLPDAVIDVPYEADTAALYGTAPYAFSKIDGPAWLSVHPTTGAITGTPDALGVDITITVRVTDDALDTYDVTQTINVVATPQLTAFFAPAALPDGATGVPYVANTGAFFGTPPYTFVKLAGPAWMTVSSSGAISGLPNVPVLGEVVTVQVTDANLDTDSVTDNINVTLTVGLSAVFDPVSLPDGTVGTPYVADTNASGGTAPYTFSKVSGPAWLSVHPSTGAISGTPPSVMSPTSVRVGVLDALGAYVEVVDVIEVVSEAFGSIYIGGEFATVNGTAWTTLARVNETGVLDTGFNPLLTGPVVYAIEEQDDGKLLFGGQIFTVGGYPRTNLARVNLSSALETGFTPDPDDVVLGIALASDQKILIGGTFNNVDGSAAANLALLATDGTLDTTYPSLAGATSVSAVAMQADGKAVAARLSAGVWAVQRFNTDGTLDATLSSLADAPVNSIAIQADGKILCAGEFTALSGQPRSYLGRYLSTGSLDPAFTPTPTFHVQHVSVQTDGKILIAGNFTSVNGDVRYGVARLNEDGTTDLTFGDPALNNVARVAVETPDGKILIGGQFTLVTGVAKLRCARLNSNGTLDASFTCDIAGAGSSVFDIKVKNT